MKSQVHLFCPLQEGALSCLLLLHDLDGVTPIQWTKHQRGNAWLCAAGNCSLCLTQVTKANLTSNKAPWYSVPWYDVLGRALLSVVVFPATQNPLIVMRKHQTNPNQGSFYKVPSQNFLRLWRSWKTRKSWETVQMGGGWDLRIHAAWDPRAEKGHWWKLVEYRYSLLSS